MMSNEIECMYCSNEIHKKDDEWVHVGKVDICSLPTPPQWVKDIYNELKHLRNGE